VVEGIRIRTFEFPQDYEAARALWESMEQGVHVGRSDSLEEIGKKLQRDPDLFLVAEDGKRMVGTVIGGFDGRRGMIYHLAVDQSYRQRCVAGRLMEEVESRLRDKGCLMCYLLVFQGNEHAARFYEKRGWGFMDQVRLFGKELS
jgi:ribosomal protein S18 acetylase RimI-like enzyme